MPDILVTGLPRSGSALVSALIDGLPNAVSLNTPAWQQALLAKHPLDILPFCKWLVGDYAWTRRQLLAQEPLFDFRSATGAPLLDGTFDPMQKRNEKDEPEAVSFIRPGLKDDFILAMRDTSFYTSALPTLVPFGKIKIIAVIRHPFDVLTSWKQLPKPLIARGQPHGIARFWPEALAVAETKMDEVDQMVQLYDLFLYRYHELKDHIHIMKLEDVLEEPGCIGKLLGVDVPSATVSRIEKRPRVLMTADVNEYRASLRKYGIYTKLYYPDCTSAT